MRMNKSLLALGMGYSAAALGRRLRARGWRVMGTTRDRDGFQRIAAQGFDLLAFDGETAAPALLDAIAEATHIVVSAPPDERGDPVLRVCGEAIAAAPRLEWIGYLSTIGVYGDHGGGWVNEETPPNPSSARSRERLAAENAWLALPNARVQIFRLSGIYGPGRSAIEKLLAGDRQTVFKPGQVFNRIHVEDIAATLEAAIARETPSRVFNITDDEPAPPQDVTAFAAGLLGMAPPPLTPIEGAALSPMARSFYAENKRVRNERIKRELGVELAYPTYREGLIAIHGALKQTR
jgi:nucleoside-diphosphate-sugar epimerase